MKYRNTIITIVVLAALIAFIYYDRQQQSAAPTPTPVPATRLLDVNPDDVSALQVSNAVSRPLARKDNGAWFLDAPTKEDADTSRLNNLVTQFAKLSATRALTDTPSDLQPFGLVTGTLTLSLTVKDKTEVVRFGNAALQGSSYYAQHVGDPKVYFVSPSVYNDAQQLLSLPPKRPTPTPTFPPTNTPAPVTPSPAGTSVPIATDTPKP